MEKESYELNTPASIFPTNRGLGKYILLNFITFGIYGLVCFSKISVEINVIAGRYDKAHTMHYLLIAFLFSWLSFGIVPLIWFHRLSNRIHSQLVFRGIYYDFDASSFWGWCVLGSLIFVGPFIYLHKLLKAMNLLNSHYNHFRK